MEVPQGKSSFQSSYTKLRNELADNSLSSKKWWGIVNSLSGKSGFTDIPVIEHRGTTHISASSKANIFCQTFAEKCTLPDASVHSLPQCQQPTSSFANVHFKPKDIRNILRNLDPAKATGPDEIPTKVLRECAAELASPLSRLFQILFSHCLFPKQWKNARVIPKHKRDSKSDPTNYRPISLLSVLSKVMESSVHKQLQGYLFRHNLISIKQYGFKPNHCTADLLTVLSQTWNNILDKGGEVYIVALDIKGAFDQVWHNGLLDKLSAKGITGPLHSWLQNYLEGRSTQVVLSGQSSSPKPINASVPQGSILGPLLFSIFIDDVVEQCNNSIFLYADDYTIYAPVTALNGPNVAASRPDLFFGAIRIDLFEQLNILGLCIDKKLLWTSHQSNICKHAGQCLRALSRLANKLDVKGRANVYKAQVMSTLEYSCLAWMNA